MSGFTFQPDETYVMPAHFGPRTTEDDGRYDDVTSSIIAFTTDAEPTAALLPPGFELADPPTVVVVHAENRGVHLMAGRGYNLLGVNLACRFHGDHDTVEGTYSLVMWEDQFLPVMLGREFLGVPKSVADVPDAVLGEHQRRFSVSEYGTKLLDAAITDLTQLTDDDTRRVEDQFNARAWMGWRLLPTPDARGIEISYPTLIDITRRIDTAWIGQGTVTFHPATREHAPISHLIATTLAQLPVHDVQLAIVTHGTLHQGHARRLN